MEKEETKPNELYAPNPKHLESPSENAHNRHKEYNFMAPLKVQVPFDEDLTNLPKMSQVTDFSQLSDHNNVTPETEKNELPFKGQRPATILSNVDKVSPIDLPDESETNKDTSEAEKVKEKSPIMKINLLEISQDTDLSKSSDDIAPTEAGKEDSPIKVMQRPIVLSNVDKLSPIDLPNKNETNEKNKTKNSTSTDEVAMD